MMPRVACRTTLNVNTKYQWHLYLLLMAFPATTSILSDTCQSDTTWDQGRCTKMLWTSVCSATHLPASAGEPPSPRSHLDDWAWNKPVCSISRNLNYSLIAKVNSHTQKENLWFGTTAEEQTGPLAIIYLPEILPTVHAGEALTVSADVHVLFNLCFLHGFPARVAREDDHGGEGQQLLCGGADLFPPLARQGDPRCHYLKEAFQLLSPRFNSLAVRLSPTPSLSCCCTPVSAHSESPQRHRRASETFPPSTAVAPRAAIPGLIPPHRNRRLQLLPGAARAPAAPHPPRPPLCARATSPCPAPQRERKRKERRRKRRAEVERGVGAGMELRGDRSR